MSRPKGRTVTVTTHSVVKRTTLGGLGVLPVIGVLSVGKLVALAVGAFAVSRAVSPRGADQQAPTTSNIQSAIAQAAAQGKIPKAVINPTTQAQLCAQGDAAFKVITKVYPVAESVKIAWEQLPCPAKAAYVAGYAIPGLAGPLGVIIAAGLQDPRVSEAFVKVRTEALKRTGLYGATSAFAKATNPVFKTAASNVTGAARFINRNLFGLGDLGH